MNEKKFRGTIGRVAIQCIEPVTGKVGDFLFTGQSHREAGTAVSPVFNDFVELHSWCIANGWRSVSGTYDYFYAP